MAATGFTPISIFYSTTASAVPLAANLVAGELAMNTNDGKLFFKDSSGVVQTMASKATGSIGGSTTQVQFNNAGVLGGSASLTWNGTVLTSSGFAGPLNGTVGATTPAAGSFTTTTIGTSETLSYGTANGVAYLNGSKVVTSGSALTWDGSLFTVSHASGVDGRGIRLVNSSNSQTWENRIGVQSLENTSYAIKDITAGAVRLLIDTSGNVLVNTTTAVSGSKLVVASGDATIYGLTVGRGAGAVATNTAVGASALAANTTGAYNTVVGALALDVNTTGNYNQAFGYAALGANTTGQLNSVFGMNAMVTNTTGSSNVAVGHDSLGSNTTASNNTAVGYQSLYTNTDQAGHTAVGQGALYGNTTGFQNTAVGKEALKLNTSGFYNNAVGAFALGANTTGNYNNAFGRVALYANTTGSNNTAIGQEALQANTTASNNTAVGYQAGYTNQTGVANTFIGFQAGYTSNATSPSGYNVAIGRQAGYNLTTAVNNTFLGSNAGQLVTSGSKNTILGQYDGSQGGLDIRTSSNYIVLSDGDGNPRGIFDGNGTFLVGATARNTIVSSATKFVASTSGQDYGALVENTNASNAFGVIIKYTAVSPNNGTAAFIYAEDSTAQRLSVRSNGGVWNYSANNANLSDSREKTNVNPAGNYLNKICAIPVRTYNYIDQNLEEDDGLTLGVFAQDVQAVAPELVSESNWGTEEEPKMRLSIYQTDLQYALMKCIQEQQALIQDLTTRLAALEAK
jgi:hypothetical protein